ncbi:MAG: ABC transporter permease [Steroidobacteraceae bacterium]|jgi:peptide/nickel transport system permease protein
MSEAAPRRWGFLPLLRWGAFGGRWRAQPLVASGLAVFLVLVAFAWLGPHLYTISPYAIHPHRLFRPPSARYPFGTDDLGRSFLARMMYGGQPSLGVAIVGSVVAMLIGLGYGMASGLSPPWVDKVLMRLLDALLALPTLVLMIFFAAIVPLGPLSLIVLLGLVSWPGLARIVRNEVLAYKERDYVLAARQYGARTAYLARKHLLRAMFPIVVVNATFTVADLILTLAGLSFLGLGIQPPTPSWGGLLGNGSNLAITGSWWLILFPGLAILLAILSLNLVGQGLLNRLEGR